VISRATAKEFLHLREWLARAQEIVDGGRVAYDASALLHEAGDSLMMKIGEAAKRLDRAGIKAPKGVNWSDGVSNRNWLIHQYDEIGRNITWATLTASLPAWTKALQPAFEEAAGVASPPDGSAESRQGVTRKEPFGPD